MKKTSADGIFCFCKIASVLRNNWTSQLTCGFPSASIQHKMFSATLTSKLYSLPTTSSFLGFQTSSCESTKLAQQMAT